MTGLADTVVKIMTSEVPADLLNLWFVEFRRSITYRHPSGKVAGSLVETPLQSGFAWSDIVKILPHAFVASDSIHR